jgi:hypothetical protein
MFSVLAQGLSCQEFKDNRDVRRTGLLCMITHGTENFQQKMQKFVSLYDMCLSYVEHYVQR